MATIDYATAAAQLTDVEQDINNAVQKLRQSKSAAEEAQTQLGGLSTKYSSLVTWIDQQATDNPTDEAIQDLKRRKDKLVTAFQGRKSTADSMVTDLNAYDP